MKNKIRTVKNVANHVNQNMFSLHRGAEIISDKIVVFGNDGFKEDPRVPQEIEHVRQVLKEHNLKEVGMSADSSGYSWAMVVDSDSEETAKLLHKAVWDGWMKASGHTV